MVCAENQTIESKAVEKIHGSTGGLQNKRMVK